MATKTFNTEIARWNSAISNHSVAKLAWAAVKDEEDCSARQQAAMSLDDSKNIIFCAPAPGVSGVCEKLTIWWGETLFKDRLGGKVFRAVIGDLRRLEREAAGIEESENTGHEPGQEIRRGDAWRAALADFDGKVELIREGHSARWTGRDADCLIEDMDDALRVLLEAPAPNLFGVVRKLELIWAYSGMSLECGAFYAQAINDLIRLARGAASPVFAAR